MRSTLRQLVRMMHNSCLSFTCIPEHSQVVLVSYKTKQGRNIATQESYSDCSHTHCQWCIGARAAENSDQSGSQGFGRSPGAQTNLLVRRHICVAIARAASMLRLSLLSLCGCVWVRTCFFVDQFAKEYCALYSTRQIGRWFQ